MTHRQYVVWDRWLRDQWNEPDRTDHYLMELIAEVRTTRTKKSTRPKKIEFRFVRRDGTVKGEPPSPEKGPAVDPLVQASKQKAMMVASGGGKTGIRVVDSEGRLVKRIPSREELKAKSLEQERMIRVPRGRPA